MYSKNLLNLLTSELESLEQQGKYKHESALESPQGPKVKVGGREVLMFASNNYLGLANHPEIVRAAKEAADKFGYGMSSVRFICGTNVLHQELEKKISDFLKTEATILFSSCFAANEAFFASLIHQTDVSSGPSFIYSDALNHASIIDGLKLVKKELFVKRIYPHNDLKALQEMLAADQSENCQLKIIATDGVFSMEGELANLAELAKLAEQYQALLFIDDSHGIGACGPSGKGAADQLKVLEKIDVFSGTLGKALGGASGGFLSGKKELIEFMRQKARPYIFSNTLPPMIAAASIKAIELLGKSPELLVKLKHNTEAFRTGVKARGFTIIEGGHPIVPIMVGEASLTRKFSQELLKEGLYMVGLWFPVVPEGRARLRAQVSAAHSTEDINRALDILESAGKKLGII
ncbi:MAG TPA: glycine C-acetyltransferase [Patescibacteria group bacterium]|nr:glycine C-acetyltransferase [Patescibacteria group bacterium]